MPIITIVKKKDGIVMLEVTMDGNKHTPVIFKRRLYQKLIFSVGFMYEHKKRVGLTVI
jgi:hypothetical protein